MAKYVISPFICVHICHSIWHTKDRIYVVTLHMLRNIEVHDIYGKTLLTYAESTYSVADQSELSCT